MDKAEIKAREDEIVRLAVSFCNEKIDAEYASLCEKMVRKLGRKRANPLERGRLEIWAAAVVYTIATMNFLFDKSFEPYLPLSEIIEHFGTSSSTVSQKAGQIRTMLKLKRYWDPDFSTAQMAAANPFDVFFLL
ncbi:MAG: hypothetical protein J6J61_06370 [Muribaculaceae bacterium]|nr:hypothetical protein [Muribaculaceae bacterium]